MAKIRGTTGVSATIAPASDTSKFPATSEQWHKGGFKSFATIAERDAMLPSYRKDGMHCYIVETSEYFRWDNGSWVKTKLGQEGVKISANPSNIIELKDDGLFSAGVSKDDFDEFDTGAYKGELQTIADEVKNKMSVFDNLTELDLDELKAQLKTEIKAEILAELRG